MKKNNINEDLLNILKYNDLISIEDLKRVLNYSNKVIDELNKLPYRGELVYAVINSLKYFSDEQDLLDVIGVWNRVVVTFNYGIFCERDGLDCLIKIFDNKMLRDKNLTIKYANIFIENVANFDAKNLYSYLTNEKLINNNLIDMIINNLSKFRFSNLDIDSIINIIKDKCNNDSMKNIEVLNEDTYEFIINNTFSDNTLLVCKFIKKMPFSDIDKKHFLNLFKNNIEKINNIFSTNKELINNLLIDDVDEFGQFLVVAFDNNFSDEELKESLNIINLVYNTNKKAYTVVLKLLESKKIKYARILANIQTSISKAYSIITNDLINEKNIVYESLDIFIKSKDLYGVYEVLIDSNLINMDLSLEYANEIMNSPVGFDFYELEVYKNPFLINLNLNKRCLNLIRNIDDYNISNNVKEIFIYVNKLAKNDLIFDFIELLENYSQYYKLINDELNKYYYNRITNNDFKNFITIIKLFSNKTNECVLAKGIEIVENSNFKKLGLNKKYAYLYLYEKDNNKQEMYYKIMTNKKYLPHQRELLNIMQESKDEFLNNYLIKFVNEEKAINNNYDFILNICKTFIYCDKKMKLEIKNSKEDNKDIVKERALLKRNATIILIDGIAKSNYFKIQDQESTMVRDYLINKLIDQEDNDNILIDYKELINKVLTEAIEEYCYENMEDVLISLIDEKFGIKILNTNYNQELKDNLILEYLNTNKKKLKKN